MGIIGIMNTTAKQKSKRVPTKKEEVEILVTITAPNGAVLRRCRKISIRPEIGKAANHDCHVA